MKKYFLHNGTEQQGPFDIEDLKTKSINKDTPIWYEGLDNWTTADKIDDLKELLKTTTPPPFGETKKTPPPIQKPTSKTETVAQPPKKKSRTGLWVGLIIVAVLLIGVGLSLGLNAQTVTIGSQVWMTKNLDVAKFRNGDPIPEAKTDEEWVKADKNEQPAWCYYKNDRANGAKYGKLYNWYAVNDPRGLAPKGYHVPSDEEWTVLTDYLGGEEKAGAKMKSKTGWFEDGNGTNSSGFSGLPGGSRTNYGTFGGIGEGGGWWSSTEDSTDYAWYRYLVYGYGTAGRDYYAKERGLSVRCLRD